MSLFIDSFLLKVFSKQFDQTQSMKHNFWSMSTLHGLKNMWYMIFALRNENISKGQRFFCEIYIKYSNLKAQHNENYIHFTGNVWNAGRRQKTKK